MSLERDLKQALRREAPPPGFAGRVLGRLERDGKRRPVRRWWSAAAATLLLTVSGAWIAREVHERRQGERAREELLLALRIASSKVQKAQNEVIRSTR